MSVYVYIHIYIYIYICYIYICIYLYIYIYSFQSVLGHSRRSRRFVLPAPATAAAAGATKGSCNAPKPSKCCLLLKPQHAPATLPGPPTAAAARTTKRSWCALRPSKCCCRATERFCNALCEHSPRLLRTVWLKKCQKQCSEKCASASLEWWRGSGLEGTWHGGWGAEREWGAPS